MNREQALTNIDTYLKTLQPSYISEENLPIFSESVKLIEVKSKDTLIIPGEVCRHVYFVLEGGFVCRYIHEKTGDASTINFYLKDLHPIMALLDSFFTQTPTNCELKAIAPSLVGALPLDAINTLRERDDQFMKIYHTVVTTAMVEENDLKTKLISYSSKEKYEYLLEEMPAVIRDVPSKYIAEFCGISAEWLSKLKKQS
ncbi:MAG: hypothetical protein AAGI38_15490 [Bacteroidota bacterium]